MMELKTLIMYAKKVSEFRPLRAFFLLVDHPIFKLSFWLAVGAASLFVDDIHILVAFAVGAIYGFLFNFDARDFIDDY